MCDAPAFALTAISQDPAALLVLPQFNRGDRFGCRLGHVASFDPSQVSGVIGVGGVGWDEGVVRKAEDAVGSGELVGHSCLQLGGGGVMDGISTVCRSHRAVTTKQPEPLRTHTGNPRIAYVCICAEIVQTTG